MKKFNIRLFLLIAIIGFAFTLASCKNNSNTLQLDFEQNSYELELGQKLTLEPVLKNGDIAEYKFEWITEDENVVECVEGELLAVGIGSATVKVRIVGKEFISATAVINVYEKNEMPVATFDVEGPAKIDGTLYIGDENKLVYEFSHYNSNVEMQFNSSNEEIATVDEEGNINALNEGKVTLTAKIVDKNNPAKYVKYDFEFNVANFNNITLELNGGELEQEFESKFRAEDEIITLPTPVKKGYNFMGWYGNKNFVGEAVKTVDPSNTHDYLFYAKWEIAKYTITLNDTLETIEYTILDEVKLPTRTKTDWRFLGWSIVDSEGNESEELITKIEEGTTGDLELAPKFGQFKVVVAETFDTSKDYKLGMYQGNKKQTLYMTGALSGYYGASTTNFANAATLNVVETEGGYHLKLTLTNGSVKYICVVKSGDYNNIKFNNSPSNVWTYDAKNNTFFTKLDSDTLFLGTYDNYTTFSASYTSYIEKGNFVSHLYEEVLITDQMRAEMFLENVEVEKSLKEDYELPKYENVTWELAEDYENAKFEDGVLKVTRPENGNGDAIVKLIATCTINKGIATKEFEVTILEDSAYEIVEVTEYSTEKTYKMGLYQGNIDKQLYANGQMDGYYGATTEKFEEAVDVQLEETTGGYYIKVLIGTTPKYLNIVASGSYTNYKYEDSAKSVWVLNEKYNTFTTKVNGTEYYAGAYKQFATFSASKLSYLSNAGNFALHFYEKVAVEPVIVEESMNIFANKGILSGKTISWTSANFMLMNEQYNSQTAIRTSDTSHFRCYKGSKTTVLGNDGAKITQVIITTTGGEYLTGLVNSLSTQKDLYTVEVNSNDVIITPNNGAVDSISLEAAAQWRLNKIVVFYYK